MKRGIIVGFILISVLTISLSFQGNLTQAQKQFLTYENPDYDISIQYPSDWRKSEDNLGAHQVALFSAPEIEEEVSSVSTIIYVPAQLLVVVQPLHTSNITINQFTRQFLEEAYPIQSDYRIIESSQSKFAGIEAQKIVMYEYVGDKTSKVLRTIGIQNGTAYMIKYLSEPGQFSKYLPVAQQMIDSFKFSLTPSNLPQQPSTNTGSPNASHNQAILSQNTAVLETSERLPSPQTDTVLRPKSDTSNKPALPESLIVTDSMLDDSRLPLRSSIINGNVTELTSSESTRGELYRWFPVASFHFNEPSGIGIVNLKHVLTGPIKFYETQEDVLEQANYWKNVPLNEQVVLEMNQPGLNYLITSVQFANGTLGVYSGIMDVDASDAKSDDEDYLDRKMDRGAEYNLIEDFDIKDIESDPAFQRVASSIICSDLINYGFQVCQQKAGSDTDTASQTLTNIFPSADDNEDQNEDEDTGNDDNDNNNGSNDDNNNNDDEDDGQAEDNSEELPSCDDLEGSGSCRDEDDFDDNYGDRDVTGLPGSSNEDEEET